MDRSSKKRVALLMLPIIIFLILFSVSYALDILASVKVNQPIKIDIIQPKNITYHRTSNKNNVLFIFKIDNKLYWRLHKSKYWVGYSLDDSPIIELKYYVKVITDVSLGTHKLTIYANDTSGNVGSSEVYFTIKRQPCGKLFLLKSLNICL